MTQNRIQVLSGALRLPEELELWEPIGTAPTDGSEIRVSHDLDRDPEAVRMAYFENGRWVCEGIMGVDNMVYLQPTIWLRDA